jgi:hypothetical protein
MALFTFSLRFVDGLSGIFYSSFRKNYTIYRIEEVRLGEEYMGGNATRLLLLLPIVFQ